MIALSFEKNKLVSECVSTLKHFGDIMQVDWGYTECAGAHLLNIVTDATPFPPIHYSDVSITTRRIGECYCRNMFD